MSRSAAFRRFSLVTVAAIAGTVALSPSAHATQVLPAPTALHTLPAPTGTDGCGSGSPYGYIGNDWIYFYANASSPDNSTVTVEFSVAADDGSASYDYSSSTASGYNAVLNLPNTDFKDGVSYTWKARSSTSDGSQSDWSSACHFTVDSTPPPAPSVSSTDFPDQNANLPAPPMRTPGTVTFKVDDPTVGDAVRFQYDLNSGIGVGDAAAPSPTMASRGTGWVPVGPDGTATVTIDPTDWVNYIEVRTEDRAGNVSGTTRYSFNTTWNGPDVHGDLNGDKHPDLVATAKDGKLYVLYGNGDGTVRAATTYADAGTDWYPSLIAQNGDLAGGDGFQDIARINAYGYMGSMVNNGLGDFNQSQSGWYRNDGGDWSATTQIALLAPDAGQESGGALLSVEKGQLLSWQRTSFGITGDSTVLDSNFGSKATLITPGDLNGDGHDDFLVRDNTSGVLRLAASNPDGSFGAPHTWRVVGERFFGSTYPLITSVGDADGDGHPDLYAVNSSGQLVFFPGNAQGGFGAPRTVATSGIDWSQVTQLA